MVYEVVSLISRIYTNCRKSISISTTKIQSFQFSLCFQIIRYKKFSTLNKTITFAKQNLIVRKSLISHLISQLRSSLLYHLYVNYSCRNITSWYYITSVLISWYCWRHYQKSWWMRHLYNNQIIIDHINILGGEFTPLLFFYRLHPFNTPVIR